MHGASTVEFALKGTDWRWGVWRVDRLVAAGVADTAEVGAALVLLGGRVGMRLQEWLTL